MDKKIYKGVIQSLLPQKGFGFISPVWANGDSEENIFFHLSETKGGKCFIPALASAEDRTEFVTKKGVKTFIPKEAQVVFFELETEGKRFAAKKIRDTKHVSDEEAAEADQNIEKPILEKTTTEEINLVVTEETIKVEEPVDEEAACEAEEDNNETAIVEEIDDNTTIKENDCDCIALVEYEGGEPVAYTKSDKELDDWLDADQEHSWFPVNYDDEEEGEETEGDIIQSEFDAAYTKYEHYRPKENKEK